MVGGSAVLSAAVSVACRSETWPSQKSARAAWLARSASEGARWAVRRQVWDLAYASASWLTFSSRVSGSIMASFSVRAGRRGRAVVAGPARASRVSDSESWSRAVRAHGRSARRPSGAVVRGTACRVGISPGRSWAPLPARGVVRGAGLRVGRRVRGDGWRLGWFPYAEGVLGGDPPTAGLEGGEDVAVVGVQLAACAGEAVAARVLGRHRVGHPPDESVQVAPLDQVRAAFTRSPPLAPGVRDARPGLDVEGAGRPVAVPVVTHPHGPPGDDPGLGLLVGAHVGPRGIRPRAEVALHHRVGQLGQRYRIGGVIDGAAA